MTKSRRIVGLGVVITAILCSLRRAPVPHDVLTQHHGLTPGKLAERFLNIEDVH